MLGKIFDVFLAIKQLFYKDPKEKLRRDNVEFIDNVHRLDVMRERRKKQRALRSKGPPGGAS